MESACWLPDPAYWLLPVGFHLYLAGFLLLLATLSFLFRLPAEARGVEPELRTHKLQWP